jgi:hypothetical protein
VKQVAPGILEKLLQRDHLGRVINPLPILEQIATGTSQPTMYSPYDPRWQRIIEEWKVNALSTVKNALYQFANRTARVSNRPPAATYVTAQMTQAKENIARYVPPPPWPSKDWKDAWFWWGVPQGILNWQTVFNAVVASTDTFMTPALAARSMAAGGLGIPYMWDEINREGNWVQAGDLRIKFTPRGKRAINTRFFPYFPWPTRVKRGYNVTTTSAPTLEQVVEFLHTYNTNRWYNKAQRDKLPASYEIENGVPTIDIFGPLDHVKQGSITKILGKIPGWAKIAVALIPGIGPVMTAASFAASAIQIKEGRDMQQQIKAVMEGTELLFEKTEGKVPASYRLSYEQWLEANKEGIEEVGLNIDLLKGMSINEGVDLLEKAQEEYEIKMVSEEEARIAAQAKAPEDRTEGEQALVDAANQIDPDTPVDPAQALTDIVLTLLSEDEAATGEEDPPKLTMQTGKKDNTLLYIGAGALFLYMMMQNMRS